MPRVPTVHDRGWHVLTVGATHGVCRYATATARHGTQIVASLVNVAFDVVCAASDEHGAALARIAVAGAAHRQQRPCGLARQRGDFGIVRRNQQRCRSSERYGDASVQAMPQALVRARHGGATPDGRRRGATSPYRECAVPRRPCVGRAPHVAKRRSSWASASSWAPDCSSGFASPSPGTRVAAHATPPTHCSRNATIAIWEDSPAGMRDFGLHTCPRSLTGGRRVNQELARPRCFAASAKVTS